jgi:hypothetical protein
VGAIILNVALLAVALGFVVIGARSRRTGRRERAYEAEARPDYVPSFWQSNRLNEWIAVRPRSR